jgi:hypothetical protein
MVRQKLTIPKGELRIEKLEVRKTTWGSAPQDFSTGKFKRLRGLRFATRLRFEPELNLSQSEK